MPDAKDLKLREARCNNENCSPYKGSRQLLARIRLEANSVIEIKCRRCNEITIFTATTSDLDDESMNLVSDGQGGFVPGMTIE